MIDRLDIRLDAEHRRKLDELSKSRRVSISDLVRALLDREYEAWLKAQRLQAAKAISALSTEDVPEPDVLVQQLAGAHEPPVR